MSVSIAGRAPLRAWSGPASTAWPSPGVATVAVAVYGLLATLVAGIGLDHGRALGLVAVAMFPLAVLVRQRPLPLALTLIAGGTLLRLTFWGLLGADQIAVSQAALGVALGGGDPYGVGYAVSTPPGAPFPYGPLALVAYAPGVWVELAAGVATMALMAWLRAWLALGIYAAAPLIATMTMSGTNDVLPGLLIAAGLLALRGRPVLGALLLALAAAIKPYAAAWFPGAVALGGWPALVTLAGVSAVCWAPLLAWGPERFLRSLDLARAIHPSADGALDLPQARSLAAIPFVAGFFSRSWLAAVLLGTAVFVIVLFFDRWASMSYWLAVAPILLIAGEETIVRLAAQRARMRPPVREPHGTAR